MSVLSRVNYLAQERLDLSMLLAEQSMNSADFRSLITFFSGSNKSYIVRGFEVTGKTGLTVSFSVADCLVFNPQDGNSSFFIGAPGSTTYQLTLPADQPNIFVEAKFLTTTDAPVNTAFWDPIALTGANASGAEFSSSADLEEKVIVQITANTVGFSEGTVKLMVASTSASTILDMDDRRELLLRLGVGGESPDPLNKYSFSNSRGESVPSGVGVGDAVDSPWRARDSIGAINDKAFGSFKNWADAVMTRISELSGSPLWYASGGSVAPVGNISLNEVFFDTLGHTIEPSSNAAFKWQTQDGGLRLVSEGQGVGSLPYPDGLIKWASNYTSLEWSLGGDFVSLTDRNFTEVKFESPIPADGGNVYLKLEREVPKGTGSSVKWANNSSYTSFVASKAVSGGAGDFTGIALNDYVRKESEGYSRYYKVVKFSDGTAPGTFDNISTPNRVADSTIIALELENITNPALGITGGASLEPLRYFRSRYSQADVYADTTIGVHLFQDADYYWLGRRQGGLFFLRDYGTMQEGEEVTTIDATWAKGRASGGNDLILQHGANAQYDSSAGYKNSSGSASLLSFYRYKRNNTVGTPAADDNSGALLSYTLASPVGLMTDGDSLWVRLSDTTGGALSNGPVTNSTDDLDNTDTSTNKWEVRGAAATPPRSFDDKDVYLVARKFTIGGIAYLIFSDGSMISQNGLWFQTSMALQNDLYLKNKASNSVLYIGANGLVSESSKLTFDPSSNGGTFTAVNSQFYYDSANNRDNIQQVVERDVWAFTGTGAKQIRLGGVNTDLHVQGNLIVDGSSSSLNTQNLVVKDKNITLGSGLLVDTAEGSGFEIADDTRQITIVATTNGSADVNLTYGSPHGYAVGDIIGVDTDVLVGGIPSGQISGEYTVQISIGAPFDAQIISTTVIRIRTSGINASSTTSHTISSPEYAQSFKKPWSVRVSAADGTYTGRTSWAFKVKGNAATPTLTPVAGYQTVPTANANTMSFTRIPFVGDDNSGATGSDTTFNFSSGLTWDNTSSTLSATNILFIGAALYQGVVDPTTPTSNITKVYASSTDHNMYQRTEDGNISLIANIQGNVYHENVAVVTSPSGNNQMAAISSPPAIVTLPKDTKRYLGQGLLATTTGVNAIVTVKKLSHGLTTGDTITVTASSAIGGISAGNLSVSGASVTVVDTDTFTYTALATSTSVASGNLTLVTAITQRSYYVGYSELEVFRNGQFLQVGVHYNEVGSFGTIASSIQFLIPVLLLDVITYRVSSNGGNFIRNGGGGGSSTLQDSYNLGATVLITPGTPISLLSTGATVLSLDGYLNWANASSIGAAPATANISLFAQNFTIYQRTSDGNVQPITNGLGSSYEESVDVVTSPSGNNQISPISPTAIITIPKDSKKQIGSFLFASTNGSNSTITVKKLNHGLIGSDLITIRTVSIIGGISASNLSVTNAVITIIDTNTFSYSALASSTSAASGSLGSVYSFSIRTYTVGNRDLEIYRNGQVLRRGVDYIEVGTDGSQSSQIQFFISILLDDFITYRLDSNGGNLFVNTSGGGGSGSLQGAYDISNVIITSPGTPVIIGSSGTVLQINGDMAVSGVIL